MHALAPSASKLAVIAKYRTCSWLDQNFLYFGTQVCLIFLFMMIKP